MGNGKLSLLAGTFWAFTFQALSGGIFLWYAKLSESFLCSDEGYFLPQCPEPRPHEGLVLVACALAGIGLGIIVPSLLVRDADSGAMLGIATVAVPLGAFVAAVIIAWQPLIGFLFAFAALPGLAGLVTRPSHDDPGAGQRRLSTQT